MKSISPFGVLLLAPLFTFAQNKEITRSDDSLNVTIRIVEETGQKEKVDEFTYRLEEQSLKSQRSHIDSVLTTLLQDGRRRRITVTIDAIGRRDTVAPYPSALNTWEEKAARSPWGVLEKHLKSVDSTLALEAGKLEKKGSQLIASMHARSTDFALDLADRLAKIRAFPVENVFSNSSSTIRSASVRPNQPFDGLLSVKFTTNVKGDVVIAVTDAQGKLQGKRELKSFEGEFEGQVEVKNKVKGVLFVRIVQNDDGVVQRVVIPSNEH